MMPQKARPTLTFTNPSVRSPLHGLQSAIARRLGMTRPNVSRVWNGFKRSRRVEAEIALALKNPRRYMRLYSAKAA